MHAHRIQKEGNAEELADTNRNTGVERQNENGRRGSLVLVLLLVFLFSTGGLQDLILIHIDAHRLVLLRPAPARLLTVRRYFFSDLKSKRAHFEDNASVSSQTESFPFSRWLIG